MRRFLLIALASAFLPGFCHAQVGQPLVFPDRPGALTGTDIMPRYKLQLETGLGFESQTDGPSTFTLSNTQLRVGLFEQTEIRVGADFLMVRQTPGAKPNYGLAPLDIELKTKFLNGSGFLPSIAFLAGLVSSHVGTKWLLPSHLSPEMHLLFENTVSDWMDICYNVGVLWDGETPTPTTFVGLGFEFDITERLGSFIESYNYLHPGATNQYLTEFGFTWLLSPRVQLDLYADLDFQQLGTFYNVSCGIAWLLN